MKSKLTVVLAILSALVLALLVLIALQPGPFLVTRSATIAAPPATVFGHVNDFHKWADWSPWAKLDPTMKLIFEGPGAGKGAVYRWAGNSEVGEGQMTILDSKPGERVEILLEFIKPFAAVNNTEFVFKADAGQTVVTWNMSGTNNFMAKAFSLFVSMDKLVGGDFKKGLAQLKSVSEMSKQDPAPASRPAR